MKSRLQKRWRPKLLQKAYRVERGMVVIIHPLSIWKMAVSTIFSVVAATV